MKKTFVWNKRGVSLVEAVIAVCVLAIFTGGVLTALMYSQSSISGDTKEDVRTALASEKMDQLITVFGSVDFVKSDDINIEPGAEYSSLKAPYIDTAAVENTTSAVHTNALPSSSAKGNILYTVNMLINGTKYPITECTVNEAENEFSLSGNTDEYTCESITGWYITMRYFYETDEFFEITGFASNTQGVFYDA